MRTEVVAITITYNPQPEVLGRQLRALEDQCSVVLIDNGSDANTLEQLKALAEQFNHCSLVCLDKNMGIAYAQNQGVLHVRESTPDCAFILTLDHDSVPSAGMVDSLYESAMSIKQSGVQFGAIGPVLFDPRSGHLHKLHRIEGIMWKKIVPLEKGPPVVVDSLNSSGSLIDIEAFQTVGLFNAEMFIDMVEAEWCFRARAAGYRFYVHQSVVLEHSMGDDVVEIGGPFPIKMPYRAPLRHFYIFRNTVFLQRQSYVPRVWKFWNIVKLLFTYAYFGVFSRDAKSQRKEMWNGLMAGIKGLPAGGN